LEKKKREKEKFWFVINNEMNLNSKPDKHL
jgi:hypothetical protein